MLAAAVQVVGELGYEKMSVARVTARAGVSRRTFYDLFEDREQCFLVAFTDTIERARALVVDTAEGQREWRAGMRAGLAALLEMFSEDPQAGRLLVVEALKTGPAVLEQRSRVMSELLEAVDGGRVQGRAAREVAPLTAEGVVGAVFTVIHARLSSPAGTDSLLELLNPLMAIIVRPYHGAAAAQKELARATPPRNQARRTGEVDPLKGLDMRLTYRTLRVLAVVAESPGTSNRMVAQAAGVADQGQISKLLTRLEALGLLRNTGVGHVKGEPNAWVLTRRGEQVQQVLNPATSNT